MNTKKGINQLIEEFLSEQDICKLSSGTYHRILKVFVRWCVVSNVDLSNPTKADVIRWKNELIKGNKSILTIDSYIKTIALFFKWLEIKGIYTDITKGLHRNKKYLGYRRSGLTADQVVKLLESLPLHTIWDKRNAAIINLMLRTGLRCVEVSRLLVSDLITLNPTGTALKIQRKGRIEKDCLMGISVKSFDPIQQYLLDRKTFGNNDPLFLNHSHNKSRNLGLSSVAIGRIVMQELTRQGLKSDRITAHSLRHTAATLSIKSGVGLWEVSKMLGHSNISTTQIYASSIEQETLQVNPACQSLDAVF